jgi:hypothetical protein
MNETRSFEAWFITLSAKVGQASERRSAYPEHLPSALVMTHSGVI